MTTTPESLLLYIRWFLEWCFMRTLKLAVCDNIVLTTRSQRKYSSHENAYVDCGLTKLTLYSKSCNIASSL